MKASQEETRAEMRLDWMPARKGWRFHKYNPICLDCAWRNHRKVDGGLPAMLTSRHSLCKNLSNKVLVMKVRIITRNLTVRYRRWRHC
jgi:hypothetical protein